jgi:hypothetical protein
MRGNTDSENLGNLSRLRRERDTQGVELRMENRLLLTPLSSGIRPTFDEVTMRIRPNSRGEVACRL